MTNYYDTEMRLQLARAGILGPMFLLAENVPPGQKPREFDAEKQLGVTDFQLGENQTIGEQQALTIHHKLHNRNYTEPLAVTVWLDAKTKLPLKRESSSHSRCRRIDAVDVFHEGVSPPVDDPIQFPKDWRVFGPLRTRRFNPGVIS